MARVYEITFTLAVYTVLMGERRDSASVSLVADSSLITKEHGWKPEYADLNVIIRHVWEWERTS